MCSTRISVNDDFAAIESVSTPEVGELLNWHTLQLPQFVYLYVILPSAKGRSVIRTASASTRSDDEYDTLSITNCSLILYSRLSEMG